MYDNITAASNSSPRSLTSPPRDRASKSDGVEFAPAARQGVLRPHSKFATQPAIDFARTTITTLRAVVDPDVDSLVRTAVAPEGHARLSRHELRRQLGDRHGMRRCIVAWREDEGHRRDGSHVAIGGRHGNNHVTGRLDVKKDCEGRRACRRLAAVDEHSCGRRDDAVDASDQRAHESRWRKVPVPIGAPVVANHGIARVVWGCEGRAGASVTLCPDLKARMVPGASVEIASPSDL
jgi:hypothetical protein